MAKALECPTTTTMIDATSIKNADRDDKNLTTFRQRPFTESQRNK